MQLKNWLKKVNIYSNYFILIIKMSTQVIVQEIYQELIVKEIMTTNSRELLLLQQQSWRISFCNLQFRQNDCICSSYKSTIRLEGQLSDFQLQLKRILTQLDNPHLMGRMREHIHENIQLKNKLITKYYQLLPKSMYVGR